MNNEYGGIWLLYSGRNTLAYNNMTDNRFNLGIGGNSLSHFVNDIDTSNTVDGKPVYYLVNQSNIFLDNLAFPEVGYFGLVNCVNITVRGLDVANNSEGLMLAYTSNSIIESVDVSDNACGIYLWSSSNNTIIGNTISNNSVGIHLSRSSDNSIRANGILKNEIYSVILEKTSHNKFVGNTISNNPTAMYIDGDSNSTILYHNNFINNTASLDFWGETYPYPTILDNGAEGNYWSDNGGVRPPYNGTDDDQDGIGDSPYSPYFGISYLGRDNYPLMGMFSDFPVIWEEKTYHVTTISNSTISELQFTNITEGIVNGKPIEYTFSVIIFNVTGENGTSGFCRICVPTALMNGTYKVFVNGTEVPHTLLSCSNSTHNYVYFAYNHSTQEVWIIPEFSTWTPMLLILIVLTVALAIYKRRLLKTPIH